MIKKGMREPVIKQSVVHLGLMAVALLMLPAVWAVSPPEGARIERDIAYGPDAAQRMDVYLPKRTEAAPVLFIVHGGAWVAGDKGRPMWSRTKWRDGSLKVLL